MPIILCGGIVPSHDIRSFFSVSFELILLNELLTYDLYVNSSSSARREHFVRIFPAGGILDRSDIEKFRAKYFQLYVLEDQRHLYLQSMVKSSDVTPQKKTEIIKDGAIEYLDTLFSGDKEFTTEVLSEAVEGCRESVELMVDVIHDYQILEVQNLIGDLSFHDFYTYDHSINVSMYCISIYKALKPRASKAELVLAGLGGMLHDLGKIQISTELINKPGKLQKEEFDEIKKHPMLGKELIHNHASCGCNHENVDFSIIERIVSEHHENFNGTGYPAGIAGKDIHVLARITAIADFFDAITTKRAYHEVLGTEEAISVMAQTIGKKIDPAIFDVFVKSTTKLVQKRQVTVELPDNFDPCQPHDELPLAPVKANKLDLDLFKKEDIKLGKIKINDSTNKKKAA